AGGALQRQCPGKAEYAGLGGRIVGLAELPLLAIDRADVDDASVPAFTHALDDVAAHIEMRIQVGAQHLLPLRRAHLVQRRVPCDAAVVDQYADRPEIVLDSLDARTAGLEIADVPAVDGNAGFRMKAIGFGVIAVIDGSHAVACLLQCDRGRASKAARTASDQGYRVVHENSRSSLRLAGDGRQR